MREGMEQYIANPRESRFWMGNSPDPAPLLMCLVESSPPRHDSRSSTPRRHSRFIKLNENPLASYFRRRNPARWLSCKWSAPVGRDLTNVSEVARRLNAGETEQRTHFPQPFDKNHLREKFSVRWRRGDWCQPEILRVAHRVRLREHRPLWCLKIR